MRDALIHFVLFFGVSWVSYALGCERGYRKGRQSVVDDQHREKP